MSLATTLGRVLLGSVFISGSVGQLRHPERLAGMVEGAKQTYGLTEVPAGGRELVTANGAIMLGAGAALALGIAPRAAAGALIASLVPTTIVGHPFWSCADPGQAASKRNSFFANAAIVGGLVLVVAGRR